MFRFVFGVNRLDRIMYEYIRGTAQVGQFGLDMCKGEMLSILKERFMDVVNGHADSWCEKGICKG